MNIIAERILNLSESETLAMSRMSRELADKGHDVINLSIGEPDFDTPEFIKEAAREAIDQNYTHYTPVNGFPELRKAITKKLKRDNNLDYTADQIVVSTGAKHSLANAVLSLVNPGDEVVVPAPYWVSYREIIKLAGGKPVYVEATLDNDFKIKPEQLEEAITSNTKLLMINSPGNPTGSVYTKNEMNRLVEVLKKHPHVFIVSDEIYEHIIFDGTHYSFAEFSEIKDRTIVVNGVSKGFAMTGWRIGFIAASKEIALACNKLQGQITSGTNSIAQRASIVAFEKDPREIVELREMKKAFLQRRDLLLSLLREIPGMKANTPGGAFYVFPDVSEYFGKSDGKTTIQNAKDFCMFLLDTAHVALVPGEAFGDPQCVRFSYATSTDRIEKAAERIKEALKKLL
ncbi:MAG: pyridoxal phosphate-dependent aminotransferase [Bacteroidales bacterium]